MTTIYIIVKQAENWVIGISLDLSTPNKRGNNGVKLSMIIITIMIMIMFMLMIMKLLITRWNWWHCNLENNTKKFLSSCILFSSPPYYEDLKSMRTPDLKVWFYYNTVTSVTKKFFIVIFPFLEVQHGVPHLFHPMGRGWWVPSHHHAPPFHRDPLNCERTAVLSDTQLEQSLSLYAARACE